MNECPNKPQNNIPPHIWDFIRKIPALKYMLEPVANRFELYAKYKQDITPYSWCYVLSENSIYFYTINEDKIGTFSWKKLQADLSEEALININNIINKNIKFKGYFTNKEDLYSSFPKITNKKGDFAWVGYPYPGTIFIVQRDATDWLDTNQIPKDTVSIDGYVENTELPLYNLDVSKPLMPGQYYDLKKAVENVPNKFRATSMLISFSPSISTYYIYKFIGDVENWNDLSLWQKQKPASTVVWEEA